MQIFFESQKIIKIALDYYNSDDASKLSQYPSKDDIARVITNKFVEVPTEEFLTYFLFNKKKTGLDEYTNYKEISRYIADAISEMRFIFCFNGESLSINSNLKDYSQSLPEHIGEAVGLPVINRIHGLIEADWSPIERMQGVIDSKRFDYQIASTGNHIIQVENKGSIVENNTKLSKKIYSHRSSIKEKKEKLIYKEVDPKIIRYGTIAAIDSRTDSIIKCWLTDPIPELIFKDPKFLRLFIRLDFLQKWITFISPRSNFSMALITRINSLKKISNPYELDNLSLKKINGEEFFHSSSYYREKENTFFSNKSYVIDNSAEGIILKLNEKELFFLGIRNELLILASQQKLDEIMNFKYPSKTDAKMIECILSNTRFKELELKISNSVNLKKSNKYIKFKMFGQLYYNSSGLVFGILPIQ